jgi:integrase/recombinase XerD
MRDAVKMFLLAVRADGLSQSTERWYERRLMHLADVLGKDAVLVDTNDLRRFVVELQEQPTRWRSSRVRREVAGTLSVHTIHGYIRAIKRLFTWLEENEMVHNNPARKLKKPKLPKLPPKEITLETVRRLIDAADNSRDRAIVLFLLDTGCRVAGLVGLRLQDITLDTRRALVTEKGRKARFVFFSDVTRRALETWIAERGISRESDFVFLGQRGVLKTSGVNQILKRLARRAGITGRFNPHSFRHAFAKQYLMDGGDLATLSDLLGHSDVQVTKLSYSVFITDELARKHAEHSPVAKLIGG